MSMEWLAPLIPGLLKGGTEAGITLWEYISSKPKRIPVTLFTRRKFNTTDEAYQFYSQILLSKESHQKVRVREVTGIYKITMAGTEFHIGDTFMHQPDIYMIKLFLGDPLMLGNWFLGSWQALDQETYVLGVQHLSYGDDQLVGLYPAELSEWKTNKEMLRFLMCHDPKISEVRSSTYTCPSGSDKPPTTSDIKALLEGNWQYLILGVVGIAIIVLVILLLRRR